MTKRRSNRSNLLTRLLEAAQRRFRSARPGSVLIMVVALLVLLALIGTAAMSTARIDRMSSKQHVVNTQVDMLLDSVKQMVIGQLVNDLFPPNGETNETDAVVTDPDLQYEDTKDVILASRLPERMMKYNSATPGVMTAPAPGDPIIWRFPSYPPLLNSASSQYQFDPPNEPSGGPSYILPLTKVAVEPTFVTLANGQNMPGLQMRDPDQSKIGTPFLAADTDGDGIADSLLFKLPVSPVDGVTYYYSVRVLDHGSALNLNMAGDPTQEVQTVKLNSGPAPLRFTGVFPASMNLYGLINSSDQTSFEGQRIMGDVKATNAPTLAQLAGSKPVGEDWNNATKPGKDTDRNDFVWLTPGDFLHHQLGRRPNFPGWFDNGGHMYLAGGIRPYGIDAAMVLASRFTIFDPSASDSVVEQALQLSIATNCSTIYDPTAVNAWFSDNFELTAARPKPKNAKAYLTAFNPMSNQVTRHRYLYINPNTPPSTKDPKDSDLLIPAPDDPKIFPSRANLNTATFEELHQNFVDTMSETAHTTQFDDEIGYAASDPYVGMYFDPISFANDPQRRQHPARMFRSPIRGTRGNFQWTLHPYQVMQLRAALAAANVMSLRDGAGFDAKPVEYAVTLQKPTSPHPAQLCRAHVFGSKPQPFITEVYVNNNPLVKPTTQFRNPRGFAAIELHNPYDFPIKLKDWKVVIIDRDKDMAGGGLNPIPLMPNSVTTQKAGQGNTLQDPTPEDLYVPGKEFFFDKNTEIQAHGYLVIWNYPSPAVVRPADKPTPTDPDAAQYLPSGIQDLNGNVVYLKMLHQMINREVVLMRPTTTGTYAPVDCFDASGMPRYPDPDDSSLQTTQMLGWHYVRANRATMTTLSRAWNFVYPGRYDGTQVDRRHQGTEREEFTPTGSEDWPANGPKTPINLGGPDRLNSREGGVPPTRGPMASIPPTSNFAIQIANTDMYQQFSVNNKPAFPLGGFARAGDVMQAPFIGSYILEIPNDTPPATPPTTFAEINPVTMDAAFAEDTDVTDDVDRNTGMQQEEIGRFAPLDGDMASIKVTGFVSKATATTIEDPALIEPKDFWTKIPPGGPYAPPYDVTVYDDTKTPPTQQTLPISSSKPPAGTKGGELTVQGQFNPVPTKGQRYVIHYERYSFAKKVFDYFTTLHAPADDYLPNKDPDPNATYPYSPAPFPVKNVSDSQRLPNRQGVNPIPPSTTKTLPTEDDVTVEGLININTANWQMLATLPLVIDSTGAVDQTKTDRLAQRIVYYRDVDDGYRPDPTAPNRPHPHGPFHSIFDITLIDQFVTMEGNVPLFTDPKTFDPNADPGIEMGKYTILAKTGGKSPNSIVRADFNDKFLNLTRVSNLLTTRSDAYTAYVMVQGWRDAGTPQATLVAQRRLAFIVDRSAVTKTNKVPKVYNVPTAN